MKHLLCANFLFCFYNFLFDENCTHPIKYLDEQNYTTLNFLETNLYGVTNWEFETYSDHCGDSMIFIDGIIYPFIFNYPLFLCSTNITYRGPSKKIIIIISNNVNQDIILSRVFDDNDDNNHPIIYPKQQEISQINLVYYLTLYTTNTHLSLPDYIIDNEKNGWHFSSQLDDTCGIYPTGIYSHSIVGLDKLPWHKNHPYQIDGSESRCIYSTHITNNCLSLSFVLPPRHYFNGLFLILIPVICISSIIIFCLYCNYRFETTGDTFSKRYKIF